MYERLSGYQKILKKENFLVSPVTYRKELLENTFLPGPNILYTKIYVECST